MKILTIKEVKQLMDDASGKDDNRKFIVKLQGTALGYGEKYVSRVYSKEPNSIIIEIV